MEKVPQIRLFGTGQSFRRKHSPSYQVQVSPSYKVQVVPSYKAQFRQKIFTSTNNNFLQPRTYLQHTYPPNDSETFGTWTAPNNYLKSSQYNGKSYRCQSTNGKTNSNPFQTNYYQNAIKICDQNRVFNKNAHTNSNSYIKGNYLQYHNHLRPRKQRLNQKKPCKYQKGRFLQQKPDKELYKPTTYYYTEQDENSGLNSIHSNEKFINVDSKEINRQGQTRGQRHKLKQKSMQYVFGEREYQNRKDNNSYVCILQSQASFNPVSFREITNRVALRQEQKLALHIEQVSIYNRLKTNNKTQIQQKSFQNYVSYLSHAFPSILQPQNEHQQIVRVNMIQQLQQLSRQNIIIKREYLKKLNDIIEEFGDNVLIKDHIREQSKYGVKRDVKKSNRGIQQLYAERQLDIPINAILKSNRSQKLINNSQTIPNWCQTQAQNTKYLEKSASTNVLRTRKKLFVTINS